MLNLPILSGLDVSHATCAPACALFDLPCFETPVRLLWRKRIYRCLQNACEITTFSEVHQLAAPRAKLTTRAIGWAVAQLRSHDIAV